MKTSFNISIDNFSLLDLKNLLEQQKKIQLSKSTIAKIKASRNYLSKKINKSDSLIYGVNTGFGSLCNTAIDLENIELLQKNLLLSHACGTGEEVPVDIVRIMLLLKIRSLSFGYSGVRLKVINELICYYNNNLFPVVFDQGSLGASGDLAPLAHLSLPLIGRGKVILGGQKMLAKTALKKIQTNPIQLSFKEGLALLNGTQFMTGYGVWSLLETEKLYYIANLIACISLEAFSCNSSPFDSLVAKIRPYKGQLKTSELILSILHNSKSFFTNNQYVQDPYSFRCIPQVHGAVFDVFLHVKNIFNIEINSVTDNPNIFNKEDKIISAGNFHGQPLAMAMDYLAIALSELGSISERRIFKLIAGERGLPPYLIDKPGLNSGFMITQYTAASIVSQNKQYATPASIDSIVSSNGQEDHVSMGANAATKLYKVTQNINTILSIELLNAAQAIDIKKIKTSSILKEFLKLYRYHVPFIKSDQQLNIYINKTQSFIRDLDIISFLKLRH